MCDLCLSFPCLPGCPNGSEGTEIERCAECGEPIHDGDKFCYIDGEVYCESCIDDMSREKLLMLCGVEMMTAEAV